MRIGRRTIRSSILLLAFAGVGVCSSHAQPQQGKAHAVVSAHKGSYPRTFGSHFETSDRCVACHNGISTPTGEDISIGVDWRTSMMANSARDPYWIAGVRRETIDHPVAAEAIQDECTICHMPMMRYESRLIGREGEAFAHFPPGGETRADRLAEDGVSCSVCHQITGEGLGTRASYVGGFKIDTTRPPGERHEYGPFDVDEGHATIMRSSSTFQPVEETKVIRSSELCATCHTLLTNALDAEGKVIGELPEQVPYQEWLHSSYKDGKSCQDCHMPKVQAEVPITSVLGEPRPGFAQHTFVGGNFFMQRMLNRYRNDLVVPAPPEDLDSAAIRTIAHLQSEAAKIRIKGLSVRNGRLEAEISIENLGGHKLPTAYPSRRVWLHVTVRDSHGKVVFESGALRPDGSIVGNDNDIDPARFEPHYTEITGPDQVEIYEAILVDPAGKVTTGLLTGLRFIKDSRLLPLGFDKRTADKDVAVHGKAETDPDFTGGGDTVRYSVAVTGGEAPFQVEAELWYQPIAYRWAMNLKPYNAAEPKRFVGYYEEMAPGSAVMLVRTMATTNHPIAVATNGSPPPARSTTRRAAADK
ncbi:MAG: hypothetical protein P8Z30_01545 [Acidobacteriota bacterium]